MHRFRTLAPALLVILFAPEDRVTAQPASFRLCFSQCAVEDWKEGAKAQFELKGALHLKGREVWPLYVLQGEFRAALGVMRQKFAERVAAVVLPTDNDLFAEMTASHPLHWKVDPFISLSVRTQITESFRLSGTSRIRTAAFRDPITTIESVGCTWSQTGRMGTGTLRLGIACKQVRAHDHPALTDDPSTRGIVERWKVDGGMELVCDAVLQLDSLLSWRTRLNVFGALDARKAFTVQFDNEWTYRLWRHIGCVLIVRLTRDPQDPAHLQFHQSLSIALLLD